MINREVLLARLHAVRERQATLHGRSYTNTDRKATEYLAEVALMALADATAGNAQVNFRVVSMPTGYGKTTTAAAFIATMAILDPSFSAAYVVKERELAEEVADMIDALAIAETGKPLATVYTMAHADKRDREQHRERFMEEFGFVPKRPVVLKSDLKSARVIVVTHASWSREVEKKTDCGVINFEGKRRLVFVDEQPDLVRIIEVQPAMVQEFHDRVVAVEAGSPLAKRLTEIVAAMNATTDATGEPYTVPPISAEGDILTFAPFLASPKSLQPYVSAGATIEEARAQTDRMAVVCRFLVSAANGVAFYSRIDKSFWSYEFALRPGAGHVLLDATADLGPIVTFLPGVERAHVEPPQVNYANLEVIHVRMPKRFANVKDTLARKSTAEEYAAWIRKVVATVAPEDARVLMIANKALFDHEYIEPRYDPADPMDIEGRKVCVNHWGSGIGSNRHKNATHVFQFGEWHLPRGATIGTVHGYNGTTVDSRQLRLAVGRRTPDGDYLPQGHYRTAAENHLLRWSKQLASRGNVRNVDGDGNCGRMVLVTTMDFRRLLLNLPRLFPGAPLPKTISVPVDGEDEPLTGRDALVALLSDPTTDKVITAREVAEKTRLAADQLKREFFSDRVQPIAAAFGWTLMGKRKAGLPGKGNVLVRTTA